MANFKQHIETLQLTLVIAKEQMLLKIELLNPSHNKKDFRLKLASSD